MKASLQLLKEANIQPKLRLGIKKPGKGMVSTGAHRVKLLQDKVVRGKHPMSGREIEFVRYLVEENGETKTYQTKKLNDDGELSYLVQRLAEVKEGEEVILEMKKQGIKNYVEVTPVSDADQVEVDEDQEHPDIILDENDES